jgi:hypothetical protein
VLTSSLDHPDERQPLGRNRNTGRGVAEMHSPLAANEVHRVGERIANATAARDKDDCRVVLAEVLLVSVWWPRVGEKTRKDVSEECSIDERKMQEGKRRTGSLGPRFDWNVGSPRRTGVLIALLAVARGVLKELARQTFAHANDELLRGLGRPPVVGLLERARDV